MPLKVVYLLVRHVRFLAAFKARLAPSVEPPSSPHSSMHAVGAAGGIILWFCALFLLLQVEYGQQHGARSHFLRGSCGSCWWVVSAHGVLWNLVHAGRCLTGPHSSGPHLYLASVVVRVATRYSDRINQRPLLVTLHAEGPPYTLVLRGRWVRAPGINPQKF